MKTKIVVYLLSFCFLLPTFAFAQKRQTSSHLSDVMRKHKEISPKVLPSKVQEAYDVKWYFLNLNAENDTVEISGDVTIKAEVVWDVMDTLCLHLHQDYTIDSILINGEKKEVVSQEHERMVTGLDMPKNTVFDAQVFYHGSVGGGGNFFFGITNITDPRWGGNKVTYTLSEPNNAYHWFPVKQDLTDKADSSWVFVTTAKPNMAASNGLLTNVVELPDNKVRYEWKSIYPIDYYLIFIAVAEYQDYSIYATIPQTGEQLLIQNYIYNTPECLSENQAAIDETKDQIEYYSEIFGEYPFSCEKYGHALAYLGGAMEHQTMTTTGYFSEFLIAHELAHQWFGDNVTCASWQYIWLNEGFATYAELLWDEHKNGREDAFNSFRKYEMANVISYGKTGSVFVPIEYIDDEDRIFNSTLSYNKGAVLLHMIRYELGDDDELFFNILQTYQKRYKDSVATAEDFKSVLEELSEIDFTTFFEQWYYGEGYPKFFIEWYQSGDKLTLHSEQTTTAPNATPLFTVTYELKITYDDNSSEIVPFYQDETTKQFTYLVTDEKTVKSITFNPNNWLLATATIRSIPNAINDINTDNRVTIYPNPATTTIYIKFDESLQGEKDIYLFDSTGKITQNIKSAGDFYTLDINHLPAGIYFLSIHNGTHTFVKKIVKTND